MSAPAALAALALLAPRALHAREDGACAAWLPADEGPGVEIEGLSEVSGVAASHRFEGLLWLHQDRGAEPALYAVDLAGGDRGTFLVTGVEAEDWEDLAAGPCPSGEAPCTCLHLADIGDNDLDRGGGVVWRIPEPDPLDPGGLSQVTPEDAVWFAYPDGPHDAEALLVDPDTGGMILVTKEDPARIYRFPGDPPPAAPRSDPLVLEASGTLDLDALGAESDAVTGGAVSPAGLRAALRTDRDLLLFAGTGVSALSSAPDVLPVPEEGQGEAVAFAPDGQTLWLVAEGEAPALWEVECASFLPEGDDPWDPLVDCEGGCGGCGTPPGGRAGALGWLVALAALAISRAGCCGPSPTRPARRPPAPR